MNNERPKAAPAVGAEFDSSDINLASPQGAESAVTQGAPTPAGWNAEHGELGISPRDFSYSPELSPEVAEDERQAWERLREAQPEVSKPQPETRSEPPRSELPVTAVTTNEPASGGPVDPVLTQPAVGPRVGFVPLGDSSEPPEPPALETAWSEPRERRFPVSLGWVILLAFLFGSVASYGAIKSRILGEQLKTDLEALESQMSTKIAQVTERVVEVRERAESFEPVVIRDTTPSGGDVSGVYSSLQLAQGSVTSQEIADGTVINVDVASGAAIAYAKLNLLGQILDADLAGSIQDAKLSQITSAGKVHGSALVSGTIDAALTANVALLDRVGQSFSGTNRFLQQTLIGASTPTGGAKLEVVAANFGQLMLTSTDAGGTAEIDFKDGAAGTIPVQIFTSTANGFQLWTNSGGSFIVDMNGYTTVNRNGLLIRSDPSTISLIVRQKSGQATDLVQVQNQSATQSVFTIASTGATTFKNFTDSTTAFQVQNAAGTSNLFVADTVNGRVGIGTNAPSARLDVRSPGGDIGTLVNIVGSGNGNSSMATVRITNSGGNNVGLYVQNTTVLGSLQAVDTTITAANGVTPLTVYNDGNGGAFGAIVARSASSTGYALVATSDGTTRSFYVKANGDISTTGSALFQNATNSTTAFQVQNASAQNLFQADTSNMNITLNGANTGQISTWTPNANSLPQSKTGRGSVAANGYVYAIGGYSNGSWYSSVYYSKLNAGGGTGSWSTNSHALPQALNCSGVVTANGYVYVLGGQTTGSVNVSTVYYAKLNPDGSTGPWQKNANALPNTRACSGAVTANGYIYVIGGVQSGTTDGQTTTYYAKLGADGSAGTWQISSNALPQGLAAPTSVVANGYVYTVGGYNGGSLNTVYYAKLNSDGTIGSWSTNANALPQTLHGAAVVAANGYVYAIGGENSPSNVILATAYYARLNSDGSTGSWATSTNALPQALNDPGAVVVNGYIYILGGAVNHSATITSSAVYYASTSRIQAAGSLDLVGISGQTLTDGDSGGSLTAGNTEIIGSLGVRGSATFMQGVSIDKELVVSGNALFRNADGATLLGVDNSNSQLTVTNIQSTGVITGVNGAASAQLKSQLASGSGLTMSGNEITDTKRSTNTAGDGRAAPDSSTGVWEATTNLVTNGGFETNTTGWTSWSLGSNLVRDTSTSKFGTASAKVTTGSDANSIHSVRVDHGGTITATGNTTYTASAWVKGPAGQPFNIRPFSTPSSTLVGALNDIFTGAWQRASTTFTTVSTDTGLLIYFGSTTTGMNFYIDGVQLEQKAFATPYVETNGGTAARSASRAQGPATLLDESQGWVSLRIRPGVTTGQGIRPLFAWGDDGANYLYLIYNGGSFDLRRSAGSATSANVSAAWTADTPVTVTASWSAGALNLSVNGANFTTAANTSIPVLSASLFDIGSAPLFSYPAFGSDVLWFAAGTGTLQNSELAAIHRFGNGDPKPASFPLASSPTMTWDGVNANYEGSDAVARSTLILDDTNLYRESAGQLATDSALRIKSTSTAAFQIQSSSGTILLTADTSNLTITLGAASATPVLIVLGNKNTAGDPTCANGAIYYNSSAGQLRGCEGGSWSSLGTTTMIYDTGEAGTSFPASSIDINNIPQGYKHLRLIIGVNVPALDGTQTIRMRLNNDSTPSLYFSQRTEAAGSSVTAAEELGSTGSGHVGFANGNFALGPITVDIPAYAASTQKSWNAHGGMMTATSTGGLKVTNITGVWRENAALTRITLIRADGGNFAAGTRMTLYGLR